MSVNIKNNSYGMPGSPRTFTPLLAALALTLIWLLPPRALAQAPSGKPPAKKEVKATPDPKKGGEAKPGVAPSKADDERAKRTRQPRGKRPPVDMPASMEVKATAGQPPDDMPASMEVKGKPGREFHTETKGKPVPPPGIPGTTPPAGTPANPPPPRAKGESIFLVKLKNKVAKMTKDPTVQLTDAKGQTRTVFPKDEGKDSDEVAGDGGYSIPVTWKFPGKDTSLKVVVTVGSEKWTGAAKVDIDTKYPALFLSLRDKGKLTQETGATIVGGGPGEEGKGGPRPFVAAKGVKGAPPGKAIKGVPPGKVAKGVPPVKGQEGASLIHESKEGWSADATSSSLRNKAIWLIVGAWGFTFLGFGLAALLGFLRRKQSQPAPLQITRQPAAVAPTRLEVDAVSAALAGPLKDRRVVVYGALPDGQAASIQCTEKDVQPEELVRAVELVASSEGAPVALLVVEHDLLDVSSKDPVGKELAELVDGRFPLWVVGGLQEWQTWSAAPAQTAESEPA